MDSEPAGGRNMAPEVDVAHSGPRVFEKYNRIHRERIKSGELRKPEHKGFLTTWQCSGRSYGGPEKITLGHWEPVIKSVLQPDSVRIVNKSFWSYLPLEAQGF